MPCVEKNNMQVPAIVEEQLQLSTFRGNKNLRGANTQVSYTKDMLSEYIKCKHDPIYFITAYCKTISLDEGTVPFHLYDYQKKLINAYVTERKVVTMQPRQSGKCLSVNTRVRLKNKSNNDVIELTLGEFYEWQKFKQLSEYEALQLLQLSI